MDILIMMSQKMTFNLLLDLIETQLESTGGMRDIMRAIQTKDLAVVVRAAIKALKNIGIPDPYSGLTYIKSIEQSNIYRKQGNLYYIDKDYKNAILSYNKALAYATSKSVEEKLAYSNISAVMLSIKAYQACIQNINAAEDGYCPDFLIMKLTQRKIEANKYIGDEIWRDIFIAEKDMIDYTKFEVPRNAEIPCASTDVCVDEGKKVIAAKEIKSGTMVALERAFVSFDDEINEYTSCFYCHKLSFFFVACKDCCKALFCSEQCRKKCLDEYHRVECHVVGHMYVESKDINLHLHKLVLRAAIKLSLQLGWEELRTASLEMGQELYEKSSVAEAFDRNKPTSLLCYDDQMTVPPEVMMNRSLNCAMTVHWLGKVPNYLPEDEEERENAIDSLSRIMLHLSTTFMRQVAIPSSAIDYDSNDPPLRCSAEVQRNVGWFSFASKLIHSCEPNLFVMGLNDHVALVALRRIKKGEPLTISFFEHFYDMNLLPCPRNSRVRQKLIFKLLEYACQCRVCLLEWHSGSHTKAKLTEPQKRAYDQYKSNLNTATNFEQQFGTICTALDELSECINTTQHRNLYLDFKKALNVCQCARDLNKSYECVQTLHPYHDANDYMDDYLSQLTLG